MFANSEAPTRTETEQAFAVSFLAFLGNIKLILMSICAAVTFTILLVAANTVAMSVRERVREVGVLKTLGFTQPKIMGLLLGESLAIALIGGLLGLLLAQGLCRVLAQGLGAFIPPDQVTISPPVLVTLLGISVLIGLASSAVPAWNASRTPILDALRVTD
jgi:putative ABC transport system permease protein